MQNLKAFHISTQQAAVILNLSPDYLRRKYGPGGPCAGRIRLAPCCEVPGGAGRRGWMWWRREDVLREAGAMPEDLKMAVSNE